MQRFIVRLLSRAADAFSIVSRRFTREARETQFQDYVESRRDDNVALHQHLDRWRQGRTGVREITADRRPPVQATVVWEMSPENAEKLKRDVEHIRVLPDRPLSLISPRPSFDRKSKKRITINDCWHQKAVGLHRLRKRWTGAGVGIAVLDTGVDAHNTELQGRVEQGVLFNTDEWTWKEQSPSVDTNGHGTHVAGLIVGKKVGVAPGARILSGVMIPNCHGHLSDFLLALDWAKEDFRVQIVNMSAGIPGYCDGLHDIIHELFEVGVILVVAVGNEARDRTRSPGNYAAVLSVGASNQRDRVAAFSGGGTIIAQNHMYHVPDLVAPGEDVYSCCKEGGYRAESGTSVAAPIVSGIIAILLERYPNITISQIHDALLENCVDLGYTPDRQGAGLIQAHTTI